MPKINIDLELSDYGFQTANFLRGSVEPDKFYAYALELGLAELMEDASRLRKEDILQAQAANTHHYRALNTARDVKMSFKADETPQLRRSAG